MEKPENWLSELVQDLGQRKVDTIVASHGITGRAMPDPVYALLDIHNAYLRKLITLGHAAPPRDPNAFDEAGWLLPNDAARKWLVSRALVGMNNAGVKPIDACVLQRIVSTCSALEPIVAKIEAQLPTDLKPRGNAPSTSQASNAKGKAATREYFEKKRPRHSIELTRQDRAALSKAWELGTDTVALQTIAMIGGDIITRITEQYTGDAYAVVRQIHNEAVETSLSTWDRLVSSVTSLFEGLLGRSK